MKSTIVGFSGQIASGKTTISRALARKLGWEWFGFGELLRAEASRRGLDTQNRTVLKELGTRAIEEGWGQFCSRVLTASRWRPGMHLVLDGVRHFEAIQNIRALTEPSEIMLVFVSTEEAVRRQRLCTRGSTEDLSSLDLDALETQVLSALRNHADIIVDGSEPTDECAREIFQKISDSQSLSDEDRSVSETHARTFLD